MKFTKLSRTAFAASVVALLLAACAPNPNGGGLQEFGTITGRLIDAKTQAPIGSATVSVGTIVHIIVPSDNGAFVLNNVPIGQQNLTINAIGYGTPHHETIAVQKAQNSPAGDAGIVKLTPTI